MALETCTEDVVVGIVRCGCYSSLLLALPVLGFVSLALALLCKNQAKVTYVRPLLSFECGQHFH